MAEDRSQGVLSKHQFLSLYVPAIMLSLGQSMIAPVIPTFARSFNVGLGQASLVFVVGQVGTLFITLPAGYLLDKVGRRPVLFTGPILTAIASFLTPLSGSFWQLLFLRGVSGAATQLWMQARLTVIADTAAYDQRGRQINWMQGMARAGTLFGPALGGFLAVTFGPIVPFWTHGVLTLMAIIPSFILIKESAPGRGRQKEGEPKEEAQAELGWRELFLLMLSTQILVVLAVQFCVNWARGGNEHGALSLYAVYAYGIDAGQLGLLNTAAIIVGLPVPFITGWLWDKYGRKAVSIPAWTSYGSSLIIIAASSFFPGSLTFFVAAYLFTQLTQGTTQGTGQILATDVAPANARGRFFAVWRLIGSVGAAVSPGVFGFVAERISYALAFMSLAIFAFAIPILVGFFFKTPQRQQEPAPSSPS